MKMKPSFVQRSGNPEEVPIIWEKVNEKKKEPLSDVYKGLMIYRNQMDVVVLDTETTGLHAGQGHKIIEIALARYSFDGDGYRKVDSLSTFVNPNRTIPPRITAITRITNRHVTGAPRIEDILPRVIQFIGAHHVLGHNIMFDIRFLNWELKKAGFEPLPRERMVDTLTFSRTMYGWNVKHRLELCARRENVVLESPGHYHSALFDVMATAEIFFSMLNKVRRRTTSTQK